MIGRMTEGLPFGPLKVLVAEDDKPSREALQKAVKELGHECRVAEDGLEAWLMHQEEPAQVVLSDWRMPRMDGLELCRRMRAADTDRHYTYFVFLTHFSDQEHSFEGLAAGADDYHGKPIDLNELQARLNFAARVLSLRSQVADENSSSRK